MTLSYRMKFLAFALLGLMNSKVALAGDKTLLSSLNNTLTVWTNATSCHAQNHWAAFGEGCAGGLTDVQAGNGSSIVVYWRGLNSANPGSNSEEVNAVIAKTVKVTVKACFSLYSTKDRKWRKKKDEIGKDKQCFKEIVEEKDWPTLDQTASQEGHVVWTVADNIGKATYFFRVFAYDADGNTIGYGDSDTFLEASSFTFDSMTIGTGENEHGIGYFKVKGYDGLTGGVITGVVIMSIVSWTLLISFFVYENFLQKHD